MLGMSFFKLLRFMNSRLPRMFHGQVITFKVLKKRSLVCNRSGTFMGLEGNVSHLMESLPGFLNLMWLFRLNRFQVVSCSPSCYPSNPFPIKSAESDTMITFKSGSYSTTPLDRIFPK